MLSARPPLFLLARPARPSPVIVEVPHAGLELPKALRTELRVSAEACQRDADLYVDELFSGAVEAGANLLVAKLSRYVVDLNRFEHDIDRGLVPDARSNGREHPRGVLWTHTSSGEATHRKPLTLGAFETRLDRYYRPYHRALQDLIEEARKRFGFVILLCAHSMPSHSNTDPPLRRADIVPGTRGKTTAAPALIELLDRHFRSAGLSVRHDEPYRGGATTIRWGKPDLGLHALQLELNRALYMHETDFSRRADGFPWLQTLCTELIRRLRHETF